MSARSGPPWPPQEEGLGVTAPQWLLCLRLMCNCQLEGTPWPLCRHTHSLGDGGPELTCLCDFCGASGEKKPTSPDTS